MALPSWLTGSTPITPLTTFILSTPTNKKAASMYYDLIPHRWSAHRAATENVVQAMAQVQQAKVALANAEARLVLAQARAGDERRYNMFRTNAHWPVSTQLVVTKTFKKDGPPYTYYLNKVGPNTWAHTGRWQKKTTFEEITAELFREVATMTVTTGNAVGSF